MYSLYYWQGPSVFATSFAALELLLVLTPRCTSTIGHVLPTMRYLEAAERKQTAGSQLIVSASNVPKFANCMDYGARSTVHGAAKDSLGRLSQGAYCNRRPVSQLAFSILLIRLGRHWSSWQVAYCRTACLLRRISCRGSELPLLAPPSGRAERLISCHHRK